MKKTHRAVIFANGPVSDYALLSTQLRSNDAIVCVDGGLRHIDALSLTPDIIIGDMDSISKQRLTELRQTTPQIQYRCEKDETDLELALHWAAESQYERVLLTGVGGGRLDHTLANIHLMAAKKWPFELCAWHSGQYLWLMSAGEVLRLDDYAGATMSLIPMAVKAEGISTEGVKYMLHNETLGFGSTRGISNVIESQEASISLAEGQLLVVVMYDEVDFP